MNFKELFESSKRPKVFEKGTSNFWNEPYISKKMLEAHLNPDSDAASRRPETIDKTVAWIKENFLKEGSSILDLGCGPGLYAERLARAGYSVTGIDFSKRSIEYAIESSRRHKLDIEYIYQSYLEIDYNEKFDVVILIYCDFGALSNESRDVLLQKVYKALKPGGFFIFDVFTEGLAEDKKVTRNWYISGEGFWSPEGHIVLSEVFHYPEEKVFLNQDIVLVTSDNFEVYRSYDHYYSEAELIHLLEEHYFRNHNFFYNIIGESNFTSNSVVFSAAQK